MQQGHGPYRGFLVQRKRKLFFFRTIRNLFKAMQNHSIRKDNSSTPSTLGGSTIVDPTSEMALNSTSEIAVLSFLHRKPNCQIVALTIHTEGIFKKARGLIKIKRLYILTSDTVPAGHPVRTRRQLKSIFPFLEGHFPATAHSLRKYIQRGTNKKYWKTLVYAKKRRMNTSKRHCL